MVHGFRKQKPLQISGTERDFTHGVTSFQNYRKGLDSWQNLQKWLSEHNQNGPPWEMPLNNRVQDISTESDSRAHRPLATQHLPLPPMTGRAGPASRERQQGRRPRPHSCPRNSSRVCWTWERSFTHLHQGLENTDWRILNFLENRDAVLDRATAGLLLPFRE